MPAAAGASVASPGNSRTYALLTVMAPLPWDSAVSYCQQLGGSLASVHSAEAEVCAVLWPFCAVLHQLLSGMNE